MHEGGKQPFRRLARRPESQHGLLRLFFALWPDDATRAAFEGLSRVLHDGCGGRRVPKANIHLTLVFLGNVRADLVSPLRHMAGAVRGETVDLVLDTAGYWRHNRIVWIGAQVCPGQLRGLVTQLTEGVRDLGIGTEVRDYVPHITLLRNAQRGPVGFALEAIEWRAAEFVLIQSVPREGGVCYEAIGRWPLAARV